MNHRRFLGLGSFAAALSALALLSGCAAVGTLSADVASYGNWPAGRAAGSYAFERLPSQQAQAQAAQALEDAARPALARAGFVPVAAGAEPDVLVQVGARVTRTERSPWDDPLWWGGAWGGFGGYGGWRHGPWRGPYVGGPYWGGSMLYPTPRYDREVAVLLRDRVSGKPLFETRASSDSYQRNGAPLLAPLFAAAMLDFPQLGINPRRVTVPQATE